MENLAGTKHQAARAITGKERPTGPTRRLVTGKTVGRLVLTGTVLAGLTTCVAPPTSEVAVIPVVTDTETSTATQPVVQETPTNFPTEQPTQRNVPYPLDIDITPAHMDSQEAYRQETERTINELILFFNSQGRDGQAEYDFLVQRLYQRLAFDVIKTVNGGKGGEGFNEEIRNSVFPDSENFFEARINDGQSWKFLGAGHC